MFNVKFSPESQRDLLKLPKDLQKRIIKKVQFFANQENPVLFANLLVNLPPATHRFRIGHYRVTFYISSRTIFIVRIRHRKDIYQG